MSQQRCVLIAALCWLAGTAFAQTGLTLRTDLAWVDDGTESAWQAFNRLDWQHRFSPNFELNFSSDLDSSDRLLLPKTQKLWHNGNLEASYSSSGLHLKAGYRNLAFGSSELLGLYPLWDPIGVQKRLTQHQGTISASYNATFLETQAHAQAKHLRYIPYSLNWETFELEEGDETGATDLYYGLDVLMPVVKGLAVRVAADRKEDRFTELGQYTFTELTGGLSAQYKVFSGANLAASFNWTNRAGDFIASQKQNLLRSSVRYSQRFSDALAGFLYYQNNSCVNRNLEELYLVSNYLRGQVQYSFPDDARGNSYLLVGAKYSPENKADAYFAEADHRLWGGLHAGAGLNYQPERQTTYSAQLGWFYSPVNELRLQFSHRENEHLDFTRDYIGLGSTIYW